MPTETLRQVWERVTQSHFGYQNVPESVLAGRRQTDWPAGSAGPFPRDTSGTGEREDIGIVPGWDAEAVISGDARAIRFSQVNARLSDEMPTHPKSHATGQLIKYSDFPTSSTDAGVTTGIDLDPNPYGWAVDIAHQPHFLFVSFLEAYRTQNLTAARHLVYEMQAFATYNYLKMPSSGRGLHRGIFATQMSLLDMRGSAWGNLSQFMAMASMVMLDEIDSSYTFSADPLAAEIVNSVQWNCKWGAESYLPGTPIFNDDAWGAPFYDLPNGRLKNSLTVFQHTNIYSQGDGIVRIGCFMQHFIAQAFQIGYGMAKAGYLPIDATSMAYMAQVARAAASFAVRLCGSGAAGTVDYRRGAHQYSVPVGTTNSTDGYPDYYTNDAALNLAIQGSLGPLPSGDTELRYHDSNTILDYIGDGYAADILPVLAMAVRDEVPGSQEAWDRVWNSATFQRSRGYWPETIAGISRKYAYTPIGYVIDDGSTPGPTPAPTPGPTSAPTSAPTPGPTSAPTAAPTPAPTSAPTASPTSAPTPAPSTSAPAPLGTFVSIVGGGLGFFAPPAPTSAPTPGPTSGPTSAPTPGPTSGPTSAPPGQTPSPTSAPTSVPTGAPPTPSAPVKLRSQYGQVVPLSATQLNGLAVNHLAYLGRIVNAAQHLDYAIQIRTVAIAPKGKKVLSIYVGAGSDETHMPQSDDTDNLVKIGEVGMHGMSGWSSLTSIAKTLNLMPPVVDIYVKNDAGVALPSSGHAALYLPASAIWITA